MDLVQLSANLFANLVRMFIPRSSRRRIRLTAGQHRPGNACQVIGHRDNGDILRRSCLDPIEPFAEAVLVSFYPRYYGTRPMHEELSQVGYLHRKRMVMMVMAACTLAEPGMTISPWWKRGGI
jgi:hypothetical protein